MNSTDLQPRYSTRRMHLEIARAHNAGVEAAAAYHDREAARYRGMSKRYVKRQATHEICAAQIRCLKTEIPT